MIPLRVGTGREQGRMARAIKETIWGSQKVQASPQPMERSSNASHSGSHSLLKVSYLPSILVSFPEPKEEESASTLTPRPIHLVETEALLPHTKPSMPFSRQLKASSMIDGK